MKKWLSKYWLLLAIWLAINLGMSLAFNKIRHDQMQKLIDNAWVDGYTNGVKSVSLSDMCRDAERVGFGVNFEEGYQYDVLRCKFNIKYFEPTATPSGKMKLEGPTTQI